MRQLTLSFQYRKRYEVTCDEQDEAPTSEDEEGFNTASGMRSHVTKYVKEVKSRLHVFQYRKRYEVTCDMFL